MKTITSRDNPALKSARKLLTRKGREAEGAFLVEGSKLISEASSAGFVIERVFVNAGALVRGEAEAGVFEGEAALEEKLFSELAKTVSPQPYIAVARQPDPGAAQPDPGTAQPDPGTALFSGKMRGAGGRVLILDRVSDPGNVGTMIRTALASGMDCVWCVKGTADAFSDKALRASAGAVFHLPVAAGLSARECIARARGMEARLVVCSAGGEDLFEAELTGSIAVVVGSEATGPQEELLGAADAVVGIPMAEASESLNAAAAAAVVMYEALRQSRRS